MPKMTETQSLTPAQHAGLARANSMTVQADRLSKRLSHLRGDARTTTAAKIVRLLAESLAIRDAIKHLDSGVLSRSRKRRRAAINSQSTRATLEVLCSDSNLRVADAARGELTRRARELDVEPLNIVPITVANEYGELFSR